MHINIPLLMEIEKHKSLLFGRLSSELTAKDKERKCQEIFNKIEKSGVHMGERTWKTLRDTVWANLKRTALAKYKKGAKYNEADNLVLAILDKESPSVKELDLSESGESSTSSELMYPVSMINDSNKPFTRKRKLQEETDEDKKNEHQIQLLTLQIIEKELQIFKRQITPYQPFNDDNVYFVQNDKNMVEKKNTGEFIDDKYN